MSIFMPSVNSSKLLILCFVFRKSHTGSVSMFLFRMWYEISGLLQAQQFPLGLVTSGILRFISLGH